MLDQYGPQPERQSPSGRTGPVGHASGGGEPMCRPCRVASPGAGARQRAPHGPQGDRRRLRARSPGSIPRTAVSPEPGCSWPRRPRPRRPRPAASSPRGSGCRSAAGPGVRSPCSWMPPPRRRPVRGPSSRRVPAGTRTGRPPTPPPAPGTSTPSPSRRRAPAGIDRPLSAAVRADRIHPVEQWYGDAVHITVGADPPVFAGKIATRGVLSGGRGFAELVLPDADHSRGVTSSVPGTTGTSCT